MEIKHEDVRSILGSYFMPVDSGYDFTRTSERIVYMIYPPDEQNQNGIYSLHKFIKMFAIPYRMVLIDEGDKECVGYLMIGSQEDNEELASMMEWIASSHPQWRVINCQEELDVPQVIGYRIANNLFHAKKIEMQGEVLD